MTRKTLRAFAFAAAFVGLAACGAKNKVQSTLPPPAHTAAPAHHEAPPVKQTATQPAPKPATLDPVIYFAFDSSDLSAKARKALNENADWMRQNPGRHLTIQGNTDKVGTPAYNLALGQRRADASKQYLVRLGIDAGRIKTISYGEERPVSKQDALNRRSVFVAGK